MNTTRFTSEGTAMTSKETDRDGDVAGADGESITFQAAHRTIRVQSGESLLMALLRNGFAWRTSTRADRPRGPFCNMGVCHECIVKLEGRGAIRACLTPVGEGDVVELPE